MAETGTSGITDAVLDEIKARTDLVDLVSSYGISVQTAGATKKACCPFHNEKTPSFNINENKGFYHCFGCGDSGDAITFVQKMEGLSFVDAVKKLAERCGVKITERDDPAVHQRKRLLALMAELAQFYHRCLLKTREAELARTYLKERDLGEEVQESFLIGYAPKGVEAVLTWAEKHGFTPDELSVAGVIKPPDGPGDKGYHRFGGRLMFSICDKRGRVVAFSGRQLVENKHSGKYVNSPETPIFRKSEVLFGFDKAAGRIARSAHREVIVCEGQIDTIRLHICGFPVAVASQGTAFTEEHARLVKGVADQVVLVFDDDAAGHKATVRTAGLFLAEGMPVRVVSLPNGDDPDSFLRAHPKEDFQGLLDNAESILSFQVRAERAKETHPETVDAVNRVAHAVLQTIAKSRNAVLRAGMVGEAAKLLNLPPLALQEELGKVRADRATSAVSPVPSPPVAVAPSDEKPIPGTDAAIAPPSMLETSFMAFLLENEYDADVDGLLGEFLPLSVLSHDFTRRFVTVWRTECIENRDLLEQFSQNLVPSERVWFDAVLKDVGKAPKSGEGVLGVLKEHLRMLWMVDLKRRRGALPAAGGESVFKECAELLQAIRTVKIGPWADVEALFRAFQMRKA